MLAITGSTGFIGSNIVDHLPYPQKRLIRNVHQSSIISSSEITFVVGDLLNSNDIENLVDNSKTLLHLACVGNPRTSNRDTSFDLYSNLIPSVNLFESFAKKNPQGHIIFASTGGNIYGSLPPFEPRKETDITRPSSSYSIHKKATEEYLEMFCQKYGIRATILRISNPYGTLLSPERAHGLIGVAFSKILNKQPISIVEHPESVRDYLHITDLLAALQLTINHPPAVSECRIYNVGSGKGHTITEVLSLIEHVSKMKFQRDYPLLELSNPTWNVLSYDSLKNACGWAPKIKLENGLKIMWESIRGKS